MIRRPVRRRRPIRPYVPGERVDYAPYRQTWLWAWCIGPVNPRTGRSQKILAGPYPDDGEGSMQLNSYTTKLYPQGRWTVETLDTRDRSRAAAELRAKMGEQAYGLEAALRNFYNKPHGLG